MELTERLHNLVAICRGDEVVYMNEAGLRILGFDSMEGRGLSSLLHKDYEELGALGLDAFCGETDKLSIKLLRADEGAVDVDMWVSSLKEKDAYMVEARDVTAHLKAARTLQARERRLEGIIDSVADGIMTVDERGVVQSINPATETIFGFVESEVVGGNILTLIPDWELAKESTDQDIYGRRKDGESFLLEMAIRELHQDGGSVFTCILRDITQRRRKEEHIRRLAHHDPLTGLPNRHLLDDRLEGAIRRATRNDRPLALMFVDLDKFKPINDTLGHAAGDEVLRAVANRISGAVRASDTVARIGGDEFVVILENLNRADEAGRVAQKILDSLAQPFRFGAATAEIGASIGISVHPDHGSTSTDLMRAADEVMYAVKKSGRNAWRFHTEADD